MDSDYVDVLLATYNGERHIGEQLDSVLSQSHRHIRVLISDDGSSDGTPQLLHRYAAQDARVQLVNFGRVGGVVANFGLLLKRADARYLMFADQDDLWLPGRVTSMLARLKTEEARRGPRTPILCFTDLCLIDDAGRPIADSFYAASKLDPMRNLDIRYLSWRSTVYGCATIFNAALKDLAEPIPPWASMHDHWMALHALRAGTLCYIEQQSVAYRQHSANVVGAKKKSAWQRLGGARRSLARVSAYSRAVDAQAHALDLGLPDRHWMTRWRFVRRNVLPFFGERPAFAAAFCLMFMWQRV